jgi:allophanate hydrolase subunit 2
MKFFQSTLEFLENGLCKEVGMPVYGKQHLGFAPGGAMDLFSHSTANILLKNPVKSPTLEIIIPPVIRFKTDCFFSLTGARYEQVMLDGPEKFSMSQSIQNGIVYTASQGDRLLFQNKTLGFRTYLAVKPIAESGEGLSGRQRIHVQDVYRWADPEGKIRILEGPEHRFLDDKSAFTRTYWTITNDFSEMGFRLSSRFKIPEMNQDTMISQAVADGTIQLTPRGPIILLKYRQTIGGYPRGFNVISADVDLLGQYGPGQIIRFKKTDPETADRVFCNKQNCLSSIVQD